MSTASKQKKADSTALPPTPSRKGSGTKTSTTTTRTQPRMPRGNSQASETLKPRHAGNPPTIYSAMNTIVKLRAGNPVDKLASARRLAIVNTKLPVGTEISTERGTYRIEAVIHEGTFGFSYAATGVPKPRRYCLKTEPMTNDETLKRYKVLKKELCLLQEMGKEDPTLRRRFVDLLDAGCTDQVKFLVTNLHGENLYKITRIRLKRSFTPSTALRVSIQMLNAIIDLHHLKYVHRYLKPHTFVVGLGDKIKSIFMCDFGLVKKYTDGSGKILPPRKKVKVMGALRYTSRHSHLHQELSRRDDLESWLYLSMEFFNLSTLPWRRDQLAQNVLYKKQKLMDDGFPNIWKKSASQYFTILKYVDYLQYGQKPDYDYLLGLLEKAKQELKADFNLPLDWEALTDLPPIDSRRADKLDTMEMESTDLRSEVIQPTALNTDRTQAEEPPKFAAPSSTNVDASCEIHVGSADRREHGRNVPRHQREVNNLEPRVFVENRRRTQG
ncbi:Protein kinase domain containing protein [Aphelenchoides avenae]|nr:Protein kinase domain containing protein [Aphelenchus avenae]